ncbi:hypothetical protein [Brazilian marseillevirus]|uniref:hypothetical protein n=1 Tax=Brazilian marseillevirus TaxID=1813599 RepID=UPI0007826D7E|nr:hypothetical protein A3303_gp076 [Brazilian marseillevirus]AMQ10584.1 hypothetical protein [Brazilian marseillevirus]
MELLLSENPLSLRTLCCISLVVNKREWKNLPREILDTVKSLQKMKRPSLLSYIDSKKSLDAHLYAEFFVFIGLPLRDLGTENYLTFENISAIRREVQLFRRFATSYVPTREERRELGVFRKKYFCDLMLGQFGVMTARREVCNLILWTGPELPEVFFYP